MTIQINDPRAKKLLVEIFKKADDKLLDFIKEDTLRFAIQVCLNFEKKGKKWEDIFLEFEWSFEANKIHERIGTLDQKIINAVDFGITNFEGKFDLEGVDRWIKSIEGKKLNEK